MEVVSKYGIETDFISCLHCGELPFHDLTKGVFRCCSDAHCKELSGRSN